MSDTVNTPDDHIQHGIDGNPNYDALKGAGLGGVAGAAVGAAAGSMTGPLGTVAGAVIGGIAGAVGSGVAVLVTDQVDNDNTLTGLDNQTTAEIEPRHQNTPHTGDNHI